MSDIFVDPELEAYLNALTPVEDTEFEKDLVAAGGPDESIKVWKGYGAIVDGHRRYKVCQKHNLPFKVKELEFESIDDVKYWMLRRQRFRRNITEVEQAVIDARMVELERKKGNARSLATVAKETGVSVSTVSRGVVASKVLDELGPKAKKAITGGEVQASVRSLVDLGRLPKQEKKKVARKLAERTCDTLADAIKSVAGNLIPRQVNPNMARVKRADAAMPEAYVDDAGKEVPQELWDVWRSRGAFYQIANDMTVVKGRIEELAKTIQCESTENVAKEIDVMREHFLGLMPSIVKGKHWINAAFVRGSNG